MSLTKALLLGAIGTPRRTPHNSSLNFNNEKRELNTVNNEIVEIPDYLQGFERKPWFVDPPPPCCVAYLERQHDAEGVLGPCLIKSRKRFTEKVEF
mgnify:CR=1 FL=1